jgi:hypothetical protein
VKIPALVALLLAAVLAAGCGLGSEEGTADEPVTLTVTRDYGSTRLGGGQQDLEEGETVIQLLEDEFDVRSRGGAVESIGGIAAGRPGGERVNWSYYVNGVRSTTAAGRREVEGGDRVWFDHHDVDIQVPAVVGSFPQPFFSGIGDKKLPVRVECAKGSDRECDEVTKRLAMEDVTQVARSTIGQAQEREVLRLLVGPWSQVRKDPATLRVERGPRASGVFARFDPAGRRLHLLDPEGGVVRTLGSGGGLVAATSLDGGAPVWMVTGTDQAGVAAAAAAMQGSLLRNRFAAAMERGRPISLPVTEDAPR